MHSIKYYPRCFLIKIIKIYQKTISFDHGWFKFFFPHGYCRFYPSCSEYGIRAIDKYGIIGGGIKTIWRILRCNPWSNGGMDEVN
ncbi:MAG: membrane protein insertion efficiency factor YidD [Patescibacteria group bacterium]|jgi:hypothetical protein